MCVFVLRLPTTFVCSFDRVRAVSGRFTEAARSFSCFAHDAEGRCAAERSELMEQ